MKENQRHHQDHQAATRKGCIVIVLTALLVNEVLSVAFNILPKSTNQHALFPFSDVLITYRTYGYFLMEEIQSIIICAVLYVLTANSKLFIVLAYYAVCLFDFFFRYNDTVFLWGHWLGIKHAGLILITILLIFEIWKKRK